MHVKIQGGGKGKYSNQGSCVAVVNYLEHEDEVRAKKNEKVEFFFSHIDDQVDPQLIIDSIDNNKKKLCRNDAKFFVMTVSLSEKEIQHLGKNQQEQSEKIKSFVRNEVMERYAENFNKELKAKDLMYFGKIHFDRKQDSKNELNAHCHIIVSRKTLNGKLRISPMTNHVNTKEGAVKGGFSRTDFYNNAEKSFDNKFVFPRQFDESFDYYKRMKKAKAKEIEYLTKQSFILKDEKNNQLEQIDLLCQKLGFNDKTRQDLLKGAVYKITGEYDSKLFGKAFVINEELVKIELQDQKFELKIGDKNFVDYIETAVNIANSVDCSNNQPIDKPKEHRNRIRFRR